MMMTTIGELLRASGFQIGEKHLWECLKDCREIEVIDHHEYSYTCMFNTHTEQVVGLYLYEIDGPVLRWMDPDLKVLFLAECKARGHSDVAYDNVPYEDVSRDRMLVELTNRSIPQPI